MEMQQLILWAAIFIVAVLAELASMQLISIWFAVGALAAFISAMFLPFWCQMTVFILVSVALLLCTRKFFNRVACLPVPTNIDKDIGSKAEVIEAIDAENKTGRVRLNGVDWNARSFDGADINIGEAVVVKEISGTYLIIERCALPDDSKIIRKYH